MATRRVTAHYAHEYEEGLANTHLKRLLAKTESYMVGDADDTAIEAMRAAGLIIEDAEIDDQLGGLETFGVGGEVTPTTPAHYVISFLCPLTEEIRNSLKSANVEVLKHIPPSSYSAHLTPDQVETMRSMPQVARVRLYGADDTAPNFESLPGAVFAVAPPEITTYEIRPDRREDLASLIEWLDKEGVEYEPSGRVIRIKVDDASTIPQQIEKLEVAPIVTKIEPIYDLRLHTNTDPKVVLQWLADRKITVLGSTARKVRVRLDGDNGTQYDEIRAYDPVDTIDRYQPPYVDNDAARVLMGVDRRDQAVVLPQIVETGAGEIVGVADTGIDDQHPALKKQLKKAFARGRTNDWSDPHGHGTHVAGSVCGDGSASGNSNIRGAAPGAQLVVQSLLDAQGKLKLPLNLNELFEEAYQENVRIHNNSWGAAFGSEYTVDSEEVDEFVWKHPDMLIVISAGNEGSSANVSHVDPGTVDLFSIGTPATAKNALTVGASRSDRKDGGYSLLKYGQTWKSSFPDPPTADETISGDPQELAAFSSRGPCIEERIKPDLVAPGTDIISARSSKAPTKRFWGLLNGNDKYGYMGGTSMAAPLVSGCAALVREHYIKVRNHTPSAALLKATLINGARWLTGKSSTAGHAKCPNFHQGFGAVWMPNVIPQPGNAGFGLQFVDGLSDINGRFDASGQKRRFQVTTIAPGELRICLSWTDPPAKHVQHALYMQVEQLGMNPPVKWTGNQDRLKLIPTAMDAKNNVQVVRIENAAVGDYMIQISNKAMKNPPQPFALVATGPIVSQNFVLYHGG